MVSSTSNFILSIHCHYVSICIPVYSLQFQGIVPYLEGCLCKYLIPYPKSILSYILQGLPNCVGKCPPMLLAASTMHSQPQNHFRYLFVFSDEIIRQNRQAANYSFKKDTFACHIFHQYVENRWSLNDQHIMVIRLGASFNLCMYFQLIIYDW